MSSLNWPLYEVFVRSKQGLDHKHVGSVRAADGEMALDAARDLYTRRNEGCSIWVVESDKITATQPSDTGPFFDPSEDKVYRHASHYTIPADIKHM
ncbi:1,2-phenylacetyl-CoA epoxidase subunit PaaB [Vibrio cincinnatiensis]|uniref:1,2-phenylacetyl-CoA epoxidase subunit PaaB n=1 Tax=Vibrio cincinnatiensis TaxID=675 RepID=UPI0013021AA4|nr:1,2-phenylacetyl-CoA epoxidase subunit PaaB [Vibrio cincinnatiensis]